MAPNISDVEFVKTKKVVDLWIVKVNNSLAMKEGVSLGFKCTEGKHSLSYDFVSDANKPVIHISFMDLLDPTGKSRLLGVNEYAVHINVLDTFWDEPVRALMDRILKTALRELSMNPKVSFKYAFA